MTHRRFYLTPENPDPKHTYYHCNTKRTWQSYITKYFEEHFHESEFKFSNAISNASFRLPGLEVKIGLLLADDEAEIHDKPTLSGAVKPSIVIDTVLSTFSVLEGLTMLSYLSSLNQDAFNSELLKKNRGKKIFKGLRFAKGEKYSRRVADLEDLRDRCIHQDQADSKSDLDYEHVFKTERLRPHIELLHIYLKSLETENNKIPTTNFEEFYAFDHRPTEQA